MPGVECVKDIYFVGLLPFDGAWNGGQAILSAIELGLEQINERDDVLPGYRINFLCNNTKVSSFIYLFIYLVVCFVGIYFILFLIIFVVIFMFVYVCLYVCMYG